MNRLPAKGKEPVTENQFSEQFPIDQHKWAQTWAVFLMILSESATTPSPQIFPTEALFDDA